MNQGFDRPLDLLPLDHRQSYLSEMFGSWPPLTPQPRQRVAGSRRLIFEGFPMAIADGVAIERAGIPIADEFGVELSNEGNGSVRWPRGRSRAAARGRTARRASSRRVWS